jgi:Spy/CpxP family protein refolding chaperone
MNPDRSKEIPMKRALWTMLILLGTITLAGAQHSGPMGPHPGHGPGGMMEGPLAEFGLFPPDFVLSNQTALGLSDKQLLAITKDVGATHDKFSTLQNDLRPLAEQLHTLLNQAKIDESAALTLASQVHDLEKQMKLTHLGLMIRVKNTLTPDQQDKLKALAPPRPNRSDRQGPPPPQAPDDNE